MSDVSDFVAKVKSDLQSGDVPVDNLEAYVSGLAGQYDLAVSDSTSTGISLLLEQFRVLHGSKHPLGFALWAHLSEEAEARMTAAVASGGGARLRPDDWKFGEKLWLIELVAPFATPENKLTEAMIADLIQNVFGDQKFKFHSLDPATGKREVKEIGV